MFTLITPPIIKPYKDYNHKYALDCDYYSGPGYGAGIVTALLRKNDISVKVIDYFVRQQLDNIQDDFFWQDYHNQINFILKDGTYPGLLQNYVNTIFKKEEFSESTTVGFSIHSFGHFVFSILLAKKIKEELNIPIVFGGCFITCFGHLYPEIYKWVNLIYKGDIGESFISEIKNGTQLPNNTTYDEKGIDFTSIPIPDFTDYEKQYRQISNNKIIIPYEPKRGCIYNCNFCVNPYSKDNFRFKDINQIINELETLKRKYNSNLFQFCDYNIGGDRDFLERLMTAFIKHNLKIKWRSHLSMGNVDKELLILLAKGGADSLAYGVESGSEQILRKINKGNTVAKAEEIIRLTSNANINTIITLMVGYPHETDNDIKATLNFLEKNNSYITNAVVRIYSVMEKSSIANNPEKYGITNLTKLPMRFNYSYDEINGLTWKKKQLQITRSYLLTRNFLENK